MWRKIVVRRHADAPSNVLGPPCYWSVACPHCDTHSYHTPSEQGWTQWWFTYHGAAVRWADKHARKHCRAYLRALRLSLGDRS